MGENGMQVRLLMLDRPTVLVITMSPRVPKPPRGAIDPLKVPRRESCPATVI